MATEVGIFATMFFFLPFYLVISTYLKRRKKMESSKKIAFFLIVACTLASLIYYFFQPSNGRIDYLYLGVVFAVGGYLAEQHGKKTKTK